MCHHSRRRRALPARAARAVARGLCCAATAAWDSGPAWPMRRYTSAGSAAPVRRLQALATAAAAHPGAGIAEALAHAGMRLPAAGRSPGSPGSPGEQGAHGRRGGTVPGDAHRAPGGLRSSRHASGGSRLENPADAVSPPGTKALAQAQCREEGTSVPMRTMQLNI